MLAKIQKWGNSLALRIPKPFALDTRLENDSLVDVSLVDGQIIIKPVPKTTWTLDELVSDIHEDNIHHEIDTGDPVGNEIW